MPWKEQLMKRFLCLVSMMGMFLLAAGSGVGQQGSPPEKLKASGQTAEPRPSRTQVKTLKVSTLSTMLAEAGFGEWGFAALVEADGHRVLVDTGSHPDTVLRNVQELRIDLSDVKEVVLTHHHWDHVRGLMTLRRELMKKSPSALSVVHVARGIFYSRPWKDGDSNDMVAMKQEFEATGGRFVEHDGPSEIFPGAWLSGPVPRKYPERNWSGTEKVKTPDGIVEDTIPEDQFLVLDTPRGLVVITGCGHAGIVNILTHARGAFPDSPVHAVIGGLHLFPATDAQLDWTAEKMKAFGVANLVGAHCTGIEAVYRLRERLNLSRKTAVVGAVGSTFSLSEGIAPGNIAR
jgi:7,8-dihydropterin-6-yl-methyl-4-(beta-D-ribofuranosyl)aminobenzene 5'-phosphate synthase